MTFDEIMKLAIKEYPNNMGGLKTSDVERYRYGFAKGYLTKTIEKYSKEHILFAGKVGEINENDVQHICDLLDTVKEYESNNYECTNQFCQNGKIEMPYNEFMNCSVCEDLRLIK